MARRYGGADWITEQVLKFQAAQEGRGEVQEKGDLQASRAQSGEHFLGGKVVKLHADFWGGGLEGAQSGGKKAGGEGGSVANVKFAGTGGDGARSSDGVVRALDHRAAFGEKNAAGFREANGFRAALEKREADVILQVANLPADRGLRDVQFQRGP